jgi:uncharacterized protein YcfJ
MNNLKTTFAIALLVFANVATAGDKNGKHKKHGYDDHQQSFEYARVVKVRPVYREIKTSTPIRECWDEPVYHTEYRQPKSAGGMLAGGLIGGIIGHQFGKGNGNRAATAFGTLIGAQIGHDAVNNHNKHTRKTVAGYEEHCKVRHQSSYESVIDGYDVDYVFQGERYSIEMPYDPGKHIKMRIQFSPVI